MKGLILLFAVLAGAPTDVHRWEPGSHSGGVTMLRVPDLIVWVGEVQVRLGDIEIEVVVLPDTREPDIKWAMLRVRRSIEESYTYGIVLFGEANSFLWERKVQRHTLITEDEAEEYKSHGFSPQYSATYVIGHSTVRTRGIKI